MLGWLQVGQFVTLKRTSPSPDAAFKNGINILELEVYGENGAKYTTGVTPRQSSVYQNSPARFGPQYLTDGKLCTGFCSPGYHCMAHTNNEANAFVGLDLGSPKPISKVKIYNRNKAEPDCCSERIIGTTLVVNNGAGDLFSLPIDKDQPEYTIDVKTGEVKLEDLCACETGCQAWSASAGEHAYVTGMHARAHVTTCRRRTMCRNPPNLTARCLGMLGVQLWCCAHRRPCTAN
jgi:hypothetical protein